MIYLTKDQIILLHSQLIAETGGSDGIRDDGLLESAVNTPIQSFAGTDLFPTALEKAARLGFGLIKNHAFVDGNKRIGAHAMLMTLALNQIAISYTQKELISIITAVAAGNSSYDDLLTWLSGHLD